MTSVKNWYRVLLAGLILLSLFTLNISPLPWYDEIDFASITHSYMDNKTFVCTANDLYFPGKNTEVLYYGPVYFWVNSVLLKVFGTGMVQFRIVNFLSGLACISLFIKIFSRLNGKTYHPATKIVFAFLVLSDYTYMQDMHSGRMDLLALLFVLAGILLADTSSKKLVPAFLLSGVLIATGLLTTPRMYIIILPYYGYLLYEYIRTRRRNILIGLVCATLAATILYFAWIIIAFGTPAKFISYLNTGTSYFDTAAGGFFLLYSEMPFYQAVYYVALLILIVLAVIRDYKILLIPGNMIALGTIVLFLAFGGGSVINMCLVTGFLGMLLINLGNAVTNDKNVFVSLLLIINVSLAGYKYAVVLRNYGQRSSKELDKWVQTMIPQQAKVVADDKYYYAVVKDGSKFQYFARGGGEEERVAYHKNVWKADYLLVSDTMNTLFDKYKNSARLIFKGEYGSAKGIGQQAGVTGSYHGFLFRFVQ
jgi:4-amino-4-deoxy-L-arabinose transferase-like glycosyltransferase